MRDCGDCKVCCKLLGVEALDPPKPPGQWCTHCRPKDGTKGCAIYDHRPKQCADYLCLWRQQSPDGEYQLPDELRPDRCKVMIQPAPPCKGAPKGWFVFFELIPLAAASHPAVANAAARMAEAGFPVVIMKPDAKTVRRTLPYGFRPEPSEYATPL